MSLRIAIWLSALLFSTCAIAGHTYTFNGKQYEDIGWPSDFYVTWRLLKTIDADGNTVYTDIAEFEVTAPYAYSSFHVTVENWFWGDGHHYGNLGVTMAGTYIDGLDFSATNDSFGWQASGNDFWSSQERGGAPLSEFFKVQESNFSTDTRFSVTFDRLLTVPEPGTYMLVLAGLGLIGWFGRRRKQLIV